MKRLIAILISMILLLALGLANAKDYEMNKKAGDYTVKIKIDKNPPVTGSNNIAVGIKDPAGKTVTDASVSIDYGMPAMPGMAAMNYKTLTALKNESYQGTLNFSMSGSWFINIKINRGGKTQTVKLNVDIK